MEQGDGQLLSMKEPSFDDGEGSRPITNGKRKLGRALVYIDPDPHDNEMRLLRKGAHLDENAGQFSIIDVNIVRRFDSRGDPGVVVHRVHVPFAAQSVSLAVSVVMIDGLSRMENQRPFRGDDSHLAP